MLLLESRTLPSANRLTGHYLTLQIVIIVSILALLLSTLYISIASSATPDSFAPPSDIYRSVAMTEQRALAAYQNLPMHFEANHGQMDDAVRFVAHGSGYALFLTPTEAVFSLQVTAETVPPTTDHPDEANAEPQARYQTLRMALLDSNPRAEVVGEMPFRSTSNYFRGNGPEQWVTDVPHYGQVHYRDIYPGIDLLYHGQQGQLQYNFMLAPGANPTQIRLYFSSASDIELDANSDLLLHLGSDIVRQKAPFTYQTIGGRRVEVASQFVILADQQVGFEIGSYDPSLPLVIDPTIIYSTQPEQIAGLQTKPRNITVDETGAAYITGVTADPDFPTTPGAYDTEFDYADPYHAMEEIYPTDAFILKLSPAGELVFSTFLGGHGTEGWYALSEYGGIAVDAAHAIYVAGVTVSDDFPTTPGVLHPTRPSDYSGYITKLTPDGSGLTYSTYIDGYIYDIALDSLGEVYIAGGANASSPVTPGAFDTTPNGSGDGYILKLSAAGDAPIYATFLGGSLQDEVTGIAVDTDGFAYVTGYTYSADFPTTAGAYDQSRNANVDFRDVFVTKLTPGGEALVYSTFIEGSGHEGYDTHIALGPDHTAYIAGGTTSVDFPITTGAYDTTYEDNIYGEGEVFVTRVSADGASLIYSTFLGGNSWEGSTGIAVDSSGAAYVIGVTRSDDFPVLDAFQPERTADIIGFITKLDPSGSALVYSSYLNDYYYYHAVDVAVDDGENAYLVAYSTLVPGIPMSIEKISDQSPNQPPLNAVPAPQTTDEDIPLTFSSGSGNPISISDPDAGTNPVQVTLSAGNGTLTLASFVGLSFSAGDGTNDTTMTFTGTLSSTNTALDGLVFRPSANFSGSTSITITTNDLGNTGTGGPLSDTDSIPITVNPVIGPITFTVNTTDDHDDGLCNASDCTLREAINAANANTGQDTIAFNIPGDGPHTIVLLTALPDITDPVQIDGCSQPGADCSQWPPTLRIELSAGEVSIPAGLSITGGNSTIRGLVINRFPRGIWLKTGPGNHIYSNFIGTDITGTLAAGGNRAIVCESDRNVIGTNGDGINDATERNLISGNSTEWGSGVSLLSDNNIVAGNFIGTDITGTQPLGNRNGIYIEGSTNRIGTNADGISDELERNIISANTQMGIGFYGEQFNDIYPAIVDTIIKGNYIGTDVTGTQPLGNSGLAGIGFLGSIDRTIIGGPSPVEQNLVAFNTGLGGIILTGNEPAPFSIQNAVRGNRIHSNTGLGIELNPGGYWTLDGPTPNDPGDADSGSNNQQNFPVLTAVTPTMVEGTLNSTPNTTFTLDFFSNTVCDPSGYGEGELFQPVSEPTTVTTDGNGDVTFSFTFVNPIPLDQAVTATATDPNGNTSEFSLCRAMPGSLSINNVEVLEGNGNSVKAIFTVRLSEASDEIVTVDYATANGTAKAGSDYTAINGTLTFQPGVISQTIRVLVLGDTRAEGNETFVINLSNPQNALLADDQGIGTITDQAPWLYSPANGALANDATPRFIWRAADGAITYRLQVDNNGDFSSPLFSPSVSSTTYTPRDALSNGRYYWRVRAKNASGQWGPWTASWSFRVDTRPPTVPVLVYPANHATLRDSTPTFRWRASTGAIRYRLQVDNNADFSSPVINILTATTSYTRPASLGDRVYYWRLAARDAAGNTSNWSAVRTFTLDAVRPIPEPTATLPATLTPAPSDTPTEVIISPTAPPTEVIVVPLQRVESDQPAIQQTGIWTSHITDIASGGSYLYSSGGFDDVLTLVFVGTQVEVIYVKHPALGTFAVEIDGAVMQLVNSLASESQFGSLAVVSGLADGQHTLRIYPVAGVVALDAFGVDALPDGIECTPTPTAQPTDIPTEVSPNQPTLTPTATSTALHMTLPFVETFNSSLNWQSNGAWTFDMQTAYRGAGWFVDSTTRGQSSTLTFDGQIDLRNAVNPELSYWQKMALATEDLFAIEVSLDSGLTWQPFDLQDGQVNDWTQFTLDLTVYRGQVITLRFRLDTLSPLPEGAVTTGLWIDELVIQDGMPTLTLTETLTGEPSPTSILTETVVPPSTTEWPTLTPTVVPTSTPVSTETPTEIPTSTPVPTGMPTPLPTMTPTEAPTETPPTT